MYISIYIYIYTHTHTYILKNIIENSAVTHRFEVFEKNTF